MPCSHCGGSGHNRRTCPEIKNKNKKDIVPENNDVILSILYGEQELRELIIVNKIHELEEEKLKFYTSLLGIKKKEFRFINLDKKRKFKIYIVNNNKNIIDIEDNLNDISLIGNIEPRSIHSLISFTGYRYVIMDEYSMFDCLDITETMEDTQIINYIVDYDIPSMIPSLKPNPSNVSLFASLKMDYLIQEMIRMGGLNNPNLEPILELHQDIQLLDHDSIDLEAAGVPNEFTNIT